jgi:hypothetical protein
MQKPRWMPIVAHFGKIAAKQAQTLPTHPALYNRFSSGDQYDIMRIDYSKKFWRVAAACLLLSVVQRRLSTPVRSLRRRVASLEGRMRLRDGTEVEVTDAMFRAAPEAALRAMAVALSLLAAGLVAARLR